MTGADPTTDRVTAAPISSGEAEALFADVRDSPHLLLAVSGGPDSTAMMVIAARWRAGLARGPRLTAATVDHGLRRAAASEAEGVARLANSLQIPHRIVRWTGAKPSTGIQEAAREHRYRLLAAAARDVGARHVVVAHTRDDQAETVLFRLARGSGLTGLAGMRRISQWRDMVIARPLLEVPKARLVATLEVAGIGYAEDPSNVDVRFARARLRRLMPALEVEGLSAERLALLARRVGRAEQALEAAARQELATLALPSADGRAAICLDLQGFLGLPGEIALRLLAHAIRRYTGERLLELAKLEGLLAAIVAASPDRGEAAPLRGGRRLRRTLCEAMITLEAERLVVERAPPRRSQRGRGADAAAAAAFEATSSML